MKKNYLKITIVIVAMIFCSTASFAQQGKSFWIKSTKTQASKGELALRKSQPAKADFYELDIEGLKETLELAPNRKTFQGQSNVIVQFPVMDGNLESFRIKEAPIMEESLQVQFPDMKSYVGQSIENPVNVIRFSVTPKGVNTMTFTDSGTYFIDPYTESNNFYISYSKSSLTNNSDEWVCDYVDELEENADRESGPSLNRNANDGFLREFRLALACTVEYSTFHGGTLPGVMTAMVNTMTRVNGVYERELSITMIMVPNTSIIFLGPSVTSDPYTNDDGFAMLTENQTTINTNIGTGNYDIGHVFSTGGGGVAALNSPCTTVKARGVTGLATPIGDAFDVDYVCHEMGHQYGGPHTFNGNAPGSSCLTQRTASNAYEPGSGSTIMAYAGICPPQNVQNNSDDYFHQKSLDEIFDNITNGNSQCANLIATGNAAPTSNAGGDFIIPISTPYKLTGSGSDDGGEASLTYTWEQYDLGPTGAPTETTVQGPIVRSYKGTNNPSRYIPRLADLVNSGGSTTWEKLASVNRNLNFRLTVRDNDIDGGQTAVDAMLATVTTAAGPFIVTSQNSSGVSWVSGTTETITWDVAGTTGSGVNTANVNILLSIDGGLTYDTVLASNVPNDGSQDITVPFGLASGSCRVMVEGAGNIFFNINSTDFALNATVTTVCNTYTTGPISTNIPDGGGANVQGTPVFIPVTVSETTPITDIRVSVDVQHSYIGDLIMQLQAPSGGGFANIWARSCNSAQFQDINVTFKDGSPAIVCASPTIGTYAPANPMTGFTGNNPSGTWNLVFVDFFNGDTGTVNEWSIELCTTTTVLGVEEPSLENSLSVFPNPNNGEFNIKFNANSNNVDVQVFDVRGRSVFNTTFDNVSGEFNESINLGKVNSGIYLLNINDGGNVVTKKLVVE
ncbi:reprolysin-like metallopeptidase [Psychroserpens sp. Hel_I_66]|uniref:reprolysin-like metallopeptidase n=1 Tax=Psychroserpens sp. Hel_I_66 TaxID=1250004 RepID=UPI00064698FC|nr:zinc-dependent metalloprotease family protein [Psychroserpens sp. Hel_I_66]